MEFLCIRWTENGESRFGAHAWRVDTASEYPHACFVMEVTHGFDAQFAAGGKRVGRRLVVPCAEQETEAYRRAGGQRMTAGPGSDGLGHQLEPSPGGQAAIVGHEGFASAHAAAADNPLGFACLDVIEQDHGIGMRQQLGHRPPAHVASPRIRQALLPPKAKALLIRWRLPPAGR